MPPLTHLFNSPPWLDSANEVLLIILMIANAKPETHQRAAVMHQSRHLLLQHDHVKKTVVLLCFSFPLSLECHWGVLFFVALCLFLFFFACAARQQHFIPSAKWAGERVRDEQGRLLLPWSIFDFRKCTLKAIIGMKYVCSVFRVSVFFPHRLVSEKTQHGRFCSFLSVLSFFTRRAGKWNMV